MGHHDFWLRKSLSAKQMRRGFFFFHQDPLVVLPMIAGCEDRCILVDDGSSIDAIFIDAYSRMGLLAQELLQAPASLCGFGGEAIQVLGQVKLAATFGHAENKRK